MEKVMKYYIQDGQVFAFEDDGSQDSLIGEGMRAMTEEEVTAFLAPIPPDPNIAILKQIRDIEITRQHEAVRSFLLDNDHSLLEQVGTDIAALRAQLT